MAYNALAHDEQDEEDYSDLHSRSASPIARPPIPPQHGVATRFQPLAMDFDNLGSPSTGLFMAQAQYENGNDNTHPNHNEPSRSGPLTGIGSKINSLVSKNTDTSYEMLEGDDYAQDAPSSPSPALSFAQTQGAGDSLTVRRQRQNDSKKSTDVSPPAASQSQSSQSNSPNKIVATPLVTPQPIRSASTRSTKMRHPTPDLQTLQGAYITNVEHLEKTAEKLSMTSSIDDAIRQLHKEQKLADSRRSSLLSSPIEMPITRQLSNPNSSIMDVNNTARSGGYSPGGFNMISPRHSLSGRGRSSSKGSRFGSRPEPELEGRPLDAFVLPALPTTSPILSRSASIAEEDEASGTLTKRIIGSTPPEHETKDQGEDGRPTTSGSTNTFEQAQQMFSDFDGEHYTPGARGDPIGSRPAAGDRKSSSQSNGNRVSMARPLTYADPSTGQQMVYYPAPVPMMLNLPQKLSKRPSSTIIEKRRTQVLNSIPAAARQSAVWLPDVLEVEGDEPLEEDHPLQTEEYMPQHQRRSMGGRRSVADLEHMPPQLRANIYFEQPSISETVEVKEDSAVATLDSILDASAYAPVNAFTDHSYAGHLGAEVYGPSTKRKTMVKSRSSSAMLLGARRSSNGDLLDPDEPDKRRSTMSTMLGFKKFTNKTDMGDEDIPGHGHHPRAHEEIAIEDEEEDDPEMEGQFDDEIYHGPPTTLLAELQLRKQQQKARVRTTFGANGMHTTLMEREAVAQIEERNRKKGRINLAWEDPNQIALESQLSDDEDVPLGILFQPKKNPVYDTNRPMGLMEMRDMEDNEPLSRRRDRITGRPPAMRASTMVGPLIDPIDDNPDETLAQRVARIKAEGGTATGLQAPRPISGDFAAELMSQFGGAEDFKGKVVEKAAESRPEEEETLGQRRKRLQSEKEARAREVSGGSGPKPTATTPDERPALKTRRSMADLLQAHPAAGGARSSSYGAKSAVGQNGLLGMHEQQQAQRASTMLGIGAEAAINRDLHTRPLVENRGRAQNQYSTPQQPQHSVYGMPGSELGNYSQQQMMMPHAYSQTNFGAPMSMYGAGPQMQYQNPYQNSVGGMGGMSGLHNSGGLYGYNNPMAASMMQLQMQMDQLSSVMAERQQLMGQKQVDMVERWRAGVSQ